MSLRQADAGINQSDSPGPSSRTSSSSAPTPIYSRGRIVAHVQDGVLSRRMRRGQYLLKPPAIAFDITTLEAADYLGATFVVCHDTDTHTDYTAPLEAFDIYGFDLDRGHGAQRGLHLARWTVTRSVHGVEAVQAFLAGFGSAAEDDHAEQLVTSVTS